MSSLDLWLVMQYSCKNFIAERRFSLHENVSILKSYLIIVKYRLLLKVVKGTKKMASGLKNIDSSELNANIAFMNNEYSTMICSIGRATKYLKKHRLSIYFCGQTKT